MARAAGRLAFRCFAALAALLDGFFLVGLCDHLRLLDFRFNALPTPICPHTGAAPFCRNRGGRRKRPCRNAYRREERSCDTNEQSFFHHRDASFVDEVVLLIESRRCSDPTLTRKVLLS